MGDSESGQKRSLNQSPLTCGRSSLVAVVIADEWRMPRVALGQQALCIAFEIFRGQGPPPAPEAVRLEATINREYDPGVLLSDQRVQIVFWTLNVNRFQFGLIFALGFHPGIDS